MGVKIKVWGVWNRCMGILVVNVVVSVKGVEGKESGVFEGKIWDETTSENGSERRRIQHMAQPKLAEGINLSGCLQ